MKNLYLIVLISLLCMPFLSKAQTCGTTNIALQRPVTFSMQNQWNVASQAVDGNFSAGWFADGDTNWISVDLGQSYNLCKIKINWTSNGRGKNYLAQVSNDESNWTTIFTRTNNSATLDSFDVIGSGRYLRIYITSKVNSWSGLEMMELRAYNSTAPPVVTTWQLAGNGGTAPDTSFLGTTDNKRLVFKTNNVTQMTILTDGFVGIGTATKPHAEAKLGVNGAIYAKKLKVTQTGWADYVFNKDYKLPSLRELEQYIQKHKHLPGVPTTAEVEKNGTDVAEIQATLLKKIEELTLYVIEQNKRMEAQQKEIETLKKQLKKK